MRIALVASPYMSVPPKQYGGSENVIYNLIKGLTELGHEPILLASGDSDVPCELLPIVDTPIAFPKRRKDYHKHIRQIKQVERVTAQKLRRLAPRVDIIHSHGFDLQEFRRYPNLTTLHCRLTLDKGELESKFKQEDVEFYLGRPDLYYASISKNQQASCPDLNYVGVVYNGEDPSDFPLVTEPEDYVCFLGRFDRDKNPHMAIQLAINKGYRIKVAGKIDAHDEGYFENEIKPLLKNPLVEYLGELGFKDKVELLSRARVNLHPTGFREPFGLTVVEAAFCGTPTLAISRGSMPELIEDGRTGVLVEDYIEGYHRIDNCFSLDREYTANRARQLFNHVKMTEQYLDAYNQVVNAYTARRAGYARMLDRVMLRPIREFNYQLSERLPKPKL